MTTNKRATSTEGIPYIDEPLLVRDSSSGFNYQSLEDSSTPTTTRPKNKTPVVRSHSSNNAELSYHLQQLRNLGKRKATITEDENRQDGERIHLTSSNLKVECDEQGTGTSIRTTMEMQTIEASIDLPVSWKPAVPRISIQRDSWDHKVEFLLAVIGYAVDLGSLLFYFDWSV